MEEEDVRAKIARLATEDHRGRDMMQKATADCLSALRSMHASIMAIHSTVPGTRLLDPTALHDGASRYQRGCGLDDDSTWHPYYADDSGAPRIRTALGGIITYNPLRDTWRCSSYRQNPPDMTRPEILDHYKEELARWALDEYPALLRKREEEEALAAARHAAEAERLAAKQAQEDSANTLAWMVGGLLILFTLIVIF